MNDETPQPDDLALGIYVDADGDLWVIHTPGTARVLTDVLGYTHGIDEDIVIRDVGVGMPAHEAHAAFDLHMLLPF